MNLVVLNTGGSGGGIDRRLGYFILGSLLAHLLLVGLWRGERPQGAVGASTFSVTLVARHGNAASQSVDSRPAAALSSEPEQPEVPEQQTDGQPQPKVEQSVNPRTANQVAVRQLVVDKRAATAVPAPAETIIKATKRAPEDKGDQPARRPPQARAQHSSAASNTSVAPLSARSGSVTDGQHALTTEARYSRVRAALFAALLPVFDYPVVARRRGWQGRVRVGLHVEADGDLIDVHLVESSGYDLLDNAAKQDIIELRNVPAVTQWLDNRGMDLVLPVSYLLRNR